MPVTERTSSSGGPPSTAGRVLSWLSRFDAGRFLVAELMVMVAVIACFSKAQSDTYWHLAAGRVMSQTGRVLLTDEFSHTNYGAPWLNFEWLSEVVFYQVYRVGGMPLLTALCALLAVGSLAFAWKLVRGSLTDRILLTALVLPLVTPGWSLRPQAFSLFLLPAVVHLVLRARYVILPPLFALWANLHGAVALGLVVLATHVLLAAVSRHDLSRSAAFALLSFGATLLTPLGVSLWPEIWRSVNRSPVNMIREWLPPGFTAEYALFWLTATAFVWLTATRWRRLRREDRTIVAISIFMLVLAAHASRNIVPFGLMAAPAISVLLGRRDGQTGRAVAPGHPKGAALRALLFAVSLAAALFVVQRRWTMTPPPADWAPMSREAVSAIRDCPGPIYNRFDVGGFIIWFVPEQKVFVDSRQDPYPDRLLREQREATTPAALSDIIARYHVRCAVLEPNSAEVPALGSLGWKESYRDGQWAVMMAPAIAER